MCKSLSSKNEAVQEDFTCERFPWKFPLMDKVTVLPRWLSYRSKMKLLPVNTTQSTELCAPKRLNRNIFNWVESGLRRPARTHLPVSLHPRNSTCFLWIAASRFHLTWSFQDVSTPQIRKWKLPASPKEMALLSCSWFSADSTMLRYNFHYKILSWNTKRNTCMCINQIFSIEI